jgi:hypothetical protein
MMASGVTVEREERMKSSSFCTVPPLSELPNLQAGRLRLTLGPVDGSVRSTVGLRLGSMPGLAVTVFRRWPAPAVSSCTCIQLPRR